MGRLALAGGRFPPLVQPLSCAELSDLLRDARTRLTDEAEMARLDRLLDRWTAAGPVAVGGRAVLGFSELGDGVEAEAGLAWAPGWNASLEPLLELGHGAWWAGFSGRAAGRWLAAGRRWEAADSDDPLTWPGWDAATGRPATRRARLRGSAWVLDAPRAILGRRLGSWSLSAGWAPRRTGPGLSGALTLDRSGAGFPALTLRRVRPVRWPGFWGRLAPHDLLLRAGRLSPRRILYHDATDTYERVTHPWFCQWLVGWEATSWLRATATQSALAAARDGRTLWPDLLQVNFPLPGTTWDERNDGPVTDRIVSLQVEGRWRRAPWPLLPAAAGRVWWEYGGTDFLPAGPGGLLPEISIPASVAGVELSAPAWDLAAEFAELEHPAVLWYTNSGFPSAFTQRDWLLGHPLGGGGKAVLGVLRWRPGAGGWEFGLRARKRTWKLPGDPVSRSSSRTLALSAARRPPRGLVWSAVLEWIREDIRRDSRVDWFRLTLRLGS